MAKITRKTQKIFAKNGAKNGQFGSGQALTLITSNDLDVIQALPAYEQGWQDATISGKKRPPLEESNGLHYMETSQIAYLFQEGMAEYDVATEYYTNSIVKESGTVKLYKSLTDNNIGNPLSDVVNWKFLIDLDNPAPVGLGTAAFEDIGTIDGTVPLIGVGDKLDSSLLNEGNETTKGIVELSTQTEANNDSNDNTVITPQKLHNAILGLDFLQEVDISGSIDAIFTNLTDYNTYCFILSGIRPNNNATNIRLQFSNDNGSTFVNNATAYQWAIGGRHTDGGNANSASTGDSAISLNATGAANSISNGGNKSYNGLFYIFNMDSSNFYKQISGNCSWYAVGAPSDRVIEGNFAAAMKLNALPVDAVRFFLGSGAFNVGSIKLYGVK